MHTSPPNAAEQLRVIERMRLATAQRSLDNGIVLIGWGLTFLIDMVAFDLSRLTGSPLAAIIFIAVFNSAFLVWRLRYARRLPIRLRQTITNRAIFLWSWYYIALVGLGVGVWVIVVGSYPPLWFTLLGLIGATPLLLSGAWLWRRAHAEQTPAAASPRPVEG
ncbi:MAG: hypothetical protein ACHQ1E_01120 [Ktedonobacterales bacterium]|jgi:hypothetical protein